jgi:hypothetical protein
VSGYYQKEMILSVSEDVARKNPYSLLVGMQISATIMESSMDAPQKN